MVYEYHIKDHLGNTRIAFDEYSIHTANKPVQENHYYPFGMRLAEFHLTGGLDENKRLYNYKELEDDHGLYWYHYGARYYDPQVGRWWTVDPVDEFYSSYLYCADNPVIFIDPDGARITLGGKLISVEKATEITNLCMQMVVADKYATIPFEAQAHLLHDLHPMYFSWKNIGLNHSFGFLKPNEVHFGRTFEVIIDPNFASRTSRETEFLVNTAYSHMKLEFGRIEHTGWLFDTHENVKTIVFGNYNEDGNWVDIIKWTAPLSEINNLTSGNDLDKVK